MRQCKTMKKRMCKKYTYIQVHITISKYSHKTFIIYSSATCSLIPYVRAFVSPYLRSKPRLIHMHNECVFVFCFVTFSFDNF